MVIINGKIDTMEKGLKAITVNPARICRVDHLVGSLRKGKHADIAVFPDNPLHLFSQTLYTIIDRQVIYEGKE